MENFDEKLIIGSLKKDLEQIQADILRYQKWMGDTARIIEMALIEQSVICDFYEERERQEVHNE